MDNWQAGDLALCVNARTMPIPGDPHGFSVVTVDHIQEGCIYTVERVGSNQFGRTALWLAGNGTPRRVDRFRKINPLTDEERRYAMRDLDAPVRETVDG